EDPGADVAQSRDRQRMVLAGMIALVVLLGVAVLLTRGDGSGAPVETVGEAGEVETRAGPDGSLPATARPPTTVASTPAEPDPTAVPDETAGETTAPAPTDGAGAGARGTTGERGEPGPTEPGPTEPGPAPEPGQPPVSPEEPPPSVSPPVIAGFRATVPGPWCGATPSVGTID